MGMLGTAMMATARRYRPPTSGGGFTLVELLTVLVILVVLLTLAAPAFTELIANQRVQTAAADLQTSLVRARSEAIKQNADVTVANVGSGWADGWTVSSASGNVEVHGPTRNIAIALSGPASIVYRSNGRIAPGDTPKFAFSASATAAARCIEIQLSGQPVVKKAACS